VELSLTFIALSYATAPLSLMAACPSVIRS